MSLGVLTALLKLSESHNYNSCLCRSHIKHFSALLRSLTSQYLLHPTKLINV